MNLRDASSAIKSVGFRALVALLRLLPARRMAAFGSAESAIGAIVVINLDRQPSRWASVVRELSRFQTSDGKALPAITRRFSAIDARDGRAVAATADVDTVYHVRDQLFVQPDASLESTFELDQPVRMTRQEVAVARSHIECWKKVAEGSQHHVLILEDDVWFTPGAATAIDHGWAAALRRHGSSGPELFYFSYSDAGGTAERADVGRDIFRPLRGLWFLSGYVLSRDGAQALLRAMPVVGPVDMWMNYRLSELRTVALSKPAILQRHDVSSDNAYSIMPFLSRAGIIDAGSGRMRPNKVTTGRLLAKSASHSGDSLSMALSVLGLRVRSFAGTERPLISEELLNLWEQFDALVDAPLSPEAEATAISKADVRFLIQTSGEPGLSADLDAVRFPPNRTAHVVTEPGGTQNSWQSICKLLGIAPPALPFPVGSPREWMTFAQANDDSERIRHQHRDKTQVFDDSPWILSADSEWRPRFLARGLRLLNDVEGDPLSLSQNRAEFAGLDETFPGNRAAFSAENISEVMAGVVLTASKQPHLNRKYRSAAIASKKSFIHGRFSAVLRSARGAGLVTGFFLHRHSPRQEIDIEITGDDPTTMLVNVYFNPGDEGTESNFGYRGTPVRVDLGFDSSADFHTFSIDWRPGQIMWAVDGAVVHKRSSWDPTPVPHLPMRLHANLWMPSSVELAGRLDEANLPAHCAVREITVSD